jgi:hypothetical protein
MSFKPITVLALEGIVLIVSRLVSRLKEPGLEMARACQIKMQAKYQDEKKTGAIAATANVKIGSLLELIEADYSITGEEIF